MALADTARLIASLELEDKFSKTVDKYNRSLTGLDQKTSLLQRGGEQVGHGLRQVGAGLTSLGTRAALVAAGGLTAVVKTAIDFETAFAGVAKTVDATGPELEQLKQGFLDLSKTIPLSVEELEGIGEQAGALGIAKDDILEFTEVVAKIGSTTDVASQDAATALGQLSNVLDLTADDFDNFGAALVDLGNKGASTESQILEITSRAGAGAHLIGLSADQTLAWASAIANLGVEAEAGGSALQTLAIQSAKNLESTKTLTVMAKTAGLTGKAFKQAFEKDASGALQTFLAGLGKLDRGAQLQVLDDANLKGIRLQRVLLGLAGDADNLTDSLNTASHAWSENAALNVEFQKRADTTAAALTILKNNLRIVANTVGSELLPVIRDLSGEFVDFLNQGDTQRKIQDFATGLAKGARDLATAFKAGQFDPLIANLKAAAGFAKTAFDAFNALPDPIKQALIAGAVANKATGGAVGLLTAGAANILGGLGKIGLGLSGFGQRGTSPQNALWVQSVGGGLGGPGSTGGGLLGGIAKATIFGAVALGIAEGLRSIALQISPESDAGKAAFEARNGGFFGLFGPKSPQSSTPQGQFNAANQGGVMPVDVVQLRGAPLDAVSAGITRMGERVRNALKEGDVHAARIAANQRAALEALRGTVINRVNAIIPHLGRTNSALSLANRNLEQGNSRQREIAQGVAAARERIGSGFQATNANLSTSNARLSTIAGKDFSPNIQVTVPVTSNVSISEVTRTSTSYAFATGSGFTSTGNSNTP